MFALSFQYLLLNIVKATNQTIDIMDVYLQVNLLFFFKWEPFCTINIFKKITKYTTMQHKDSYKLFGRYVEKSWTEKKCPAMENSKDTLYNK